MERRTLQSSANSSQTSRLAKYWAKHPERFSFPYNSRKFFEQWRKEKGELNVASFLCKPLSAYDNKAIYPYKWNRLDELFMAWCVLVGKAMGDTALSKLPSIDTALKTAQSRRSKFGRKTTKPAKLQPAKTKKLQAQKKTTTRQTKMTFDRKPPKTKK